MSIPFGFLLIPARILWNSWNSAEFLDSGRNPAGISGGMESIDGPGLRRILKELNC